MVTLQIINLLKIDYEIHLIPFGFPSSEDIPYTIPEGVILENISFPKELTQFDINFYSLLKKKHYIKAIGFLFKLINNLLFGRFKYRKTLKNMTSNEDIIIFPSVELMIYAPRKRNVVWHFHYNSHSYFNLPSRLFRLFARKPNSFVFLTEATKEKVHPSKKIYSTSILNPSRFPKILNSEYHNNILMSACRLEDQKDPMLMMEIALELKKRNFPFVYNIYGKGSLKGKMIEFKEKHNLDNVNFIEGITNLTPEYLSSDLFILTSKFEGLPLSAIEATSLSLPIIRREMSDPTSTFMIEGKNGFIIPKRDPKLFADKIIGLLSNKNSLAELKKSTYLTSKRFDESEIYNRWKIELDIMFNSY